jgi:hypothetical protein
MIRTVPRHRVPGTRLPDDEEAIAWRCSQSIADPAGVACRRSDLPAAAGGGRGGAVARGLWWRPGARPVVARGPWWRRGRHGCGQSGRAPALGEAIGSRATSAPAAWTGGSRGGGIELGGAMCTERRTGPRRRGVVVAALAAGGGPARSEVGRPRLSDSGGGRHRPRYPRKNAHTPPNRPGVGDIDPDTAPPHFAKRPHSGRHRPPSVAAARTPAPPERHSRPAPEAPAPIRCLHHTCRQPEQRAPA